MISRSLLTVEPISLLETPISLISHNHAAPGGSLPTHASGDLIVAVGINFDGDSISTPAGWTLETTGGFPGTGPYRVWVGYKVAASASEAAATWTNVDVVTYAVFRDWGSIGQVSTGSDISSPYALYNSTVEESNGSCFVVQFLYAVGAGNTPTLSNSYYTETTPVDAGGATCHLAYRAGLVDKDLPDTEATYSPGAGYMVRAFVEVKA